MASIANTVDDSDLGGVGATQQMMTQFGVVIGIQVMQATQAARESVVGEAAAFRDAYLVGAGAALVGLGFAFFVRSTKHDTDYDDASRDDPGRDDGAEDLIPSPA